MTGCLIACMACPLPWTGGAAPRGRLEPARRPPPPVLRAATPLAAQEPRYWPDYQPRQYRAQCQWHLRVRDGRWTEPGQGISNRYLRRDRDDRRGQSAARCGTIWRRDAD